MKITLNRIFQILAVLFGLLSGLVAFSSWQVLKFGEASDQASLRRFKSFLLAQELRQSSDDLTRLARTYVVTGDEKWEKQYFEVLDIRNGKAERPQHYEGIYWDFKAAGIAPPQHLGAPAALADLMKAEGFTEAEFGKLNEAKANSDDLVRTETVAMNMVKGLFDDGKGGFTRKAEPDQAKAQTMMHDLAYHQYKAKIMKPVQEFLEALDQRTTAEVAVAEAARTRWGAIALGAIALMTAVMITAIFWARRTIFGLFSKLRTVVTAIATGDLVAHSDEVYDEDAVGDVLRSVGSMRTGLKGIIAQIRNSADSVATGSTEIAIGNADLSQRTEEQASNLQQTAASMEQLTGTVRNTAETAGQASKLANDAAAAAANGGEMVSQAVATMQDIAASSTKIADIIGVIDGIAFQTNILALNAAVEAARAGEQGRGFAVVATEVRSLAGRSAQAAKEIKSLIGASVERVEIGSRQVNDAGKSMDGIVTQVQRVSQLLSEISNATTEQSVGIRQVGDAVAQLDQVTQQNAALVEESAAAAESLKHHAAQLAEVVTTFKIER